VPAASPDAGQAAVRTVPAAPSPGDSPAAAAPPEVFTRIAPVRDAGPAPGQPGPAAGTFAGGSGAEPGPDAAVTGTATAIAPEREEDPARVAASGPETPAAAPTVGELDRLWPEIVRVVRERFSETLAHVLETAWPLNVDADAGLVELGLPADLAFSKRRGETPESRDHFAAALQEVGGTFMRPVYTLVDGGRHEQASEPVLSGEELLEKLKSEFGATELESDSGWQMPEEAN